MLGAIIGDVVGSVYEFDNIKTKSFNFWGRDCIITDDSIMTMAVFCALEKAKGNTQKLYSITSRFERKWGAKFYPEKSYGVKFKIWLELKNGQPYESNGNGAGMKVSPVAYFAKNLEEVKKLSWAVTAQTHNHIEGIKGAEAVASAVFLARTGKSKSEIKDYIEKNYYSLNFSYESLVENYKYNETCQNTIPQAIFCFLISENFEDAIRIGVSIGGDTDTLCAITGAIAEAFYGIPHQILKQLYFYLDKRQIKVVNRMLTLTKKFKKVDL